MALHTIKIKKYQDIIEEYTAVSAITPGELLELTSAGEVQAHSDAGQNAERLFALEDELQGNDIDDDYSADDKVQVWVAQTGEWVYAWLAEGQDVSIGDFLESDGAGALQAHTADVVQGGSSAELVADVSIYTNQIIGVALEAKDTSHKSSAESSAARGRQRIKIRVM